LYLNGKLLHVRRGRPSELHDHRDLRLEVVKEDIRGQQQPD